MNINWEKITQKAVDIAIDSGKFFVREAERKAQSTEKAVERTEKAVELKAKHKRKVLSSRAREKINEAHEKINDMYKEIGNTSKTIYDLEIKHHSRYKNDEDDGYYDDQYEPDVKKIEEKDFAENLSAKLTEGELEIKINEQIDSSSKLFELAPDDIAKSESRWCSLGKLKNIECDLLSKDVAGLLRLSVAGQVVYIVRVIEIKSGGFHKKVLDLRNYSTISNHKLRDMICRNLNSIDVDILNVGKSSEDVDFVRSLEKEMIKKYKPKWN